MSTSTAKFVSLSAAFIGGIAVASLVSTSVIAQPADPGDGQGIPQMDPEVMQRWAAVSAPGEQHAELVASAGQWRVSSKFWMDPNGDPQTSELRSVVTPELGGRFISERISGQVMGEHYEGFGVFGYDNHKGKWTSVWFDNMNTAMTYAEGEETEDGTIEMFGEMYDPMTDKEHEFKIVLWEDGPNTHYMAMHSKHDGEWVKGMEMEYKRAGDAGQRPRREHPQGDHPR